MNEPKSPYRAPSPSKKHERRAPDDGGLDASAFEKKQARKRDLEAQADEGRIALATRQLRIRAGMALGLAVVALAFAAPALSEPHVRVRGLARITILGGGLLGYALYTLIVGAGGAESVDALPRRIVIGQVVAAIVGAACGVLLFGW